MIRNLTIQDVMQAIAQNSPPTNKRIFPVLRGGYPIALILQAYHGCILVENPDECDVIVDDLVASGDTMRDHIDRYAKPFWAPFNADNTQEWLAFPWEKEITDDVDTLVTRLLQLHAIPVADEVIAGVKAALASYKGEVHAGE